MLLFKVNGGNLPNEVFLKAERIKNSFHSRRKLLPLVTTQDDVYIKEIENTLNHSK